jgi:pimeloyl-ACP methyl ester carboxylesterase
MNTAMLRDEVVVPIERMRLTGSLIVPPEALGQVLFAHGSGSSRHSPRNRYVARVLQEARIGTLLLDLLNPHEERLDSVTGHLRFDIEFLAERLVGAIEFLEQRAETRNLPLGLFGASTGAAAALVAAALRPRSVRAVVSRGGRPDLAGKSLGAVRAATLLIVGGTDTPVIPLNQDALRRLGCVEKRLEVVPGASHLFEEPGALEQVASLASDWFTRHLVAALGRRSEM